MLLRTDTTIVHQQKGWDRRRWGHPQGAVHMAAATTLGSKEAMVGTGWASGCMNGLRKHYSHFVEGSKGRPFLF